MASVTFQEILLYPASEPGDQIVLPATDINESEAALGAVRQYAGGARRSITATGKAPNIQVTMRYPTRAIAETLADWLGQVVVWRDHTGRVIWALLARVQRNESPSAPPDRVSRVTLTLQPTTDTAAT